MKKPGFMFWLYLAGAICSALLLGADIASDHRWWGVLWLATMLANLAAAVDAVWPEREKE